MLVINRHARLNNLRNLKTKRRQPSGSQSGGNEQRSELTDTTPDVEPSVDSDPNEGSGDSETTTQTSPDGAQAEAARGISDALQGKVTDLELTAAGTDAYSGTGTFTGLGEFSGNACTLTASKKGEHWSVRAHGQTTGGRALASGQITLMAEGDSAIFNGRGVLRDIGIVKGVTTDLGGTLGPDGSAVADLGTFTTKLRGPLGFAAGTATLANVTLDLASGLVNAASGSAAISNEYIGSFTSQDLRVVDGDLVGSFELATANLRIPQDGKVCFIGTLGGTLALEAGTWKGTRVGGVGHVLLVEKNLALPVEFGVELGAEGLGPATGTLTAPTKLNDTVTLQTLDFKADLQRYDVECRGSAGVSIDGFETAVAAFQAHSKERFIRVTVDQIALKERMIGQAKVSGHARQLALDTLLRSFASQDVRIEIEMPYLGRVAGQTSIFDNKLQQTELTITKHIGLPSATPLIEGDIQGALRFDGTTFDGGQVRAPMDLNLGGQKTPGVFHAGLDVSPSGDFAVKVGVRSPVRMSQFLTVKGAELLYDSQTGGRGNIDFQFHEIAGATIDVPMPVQNKEAVAQNLNAKPQNDAFGFDLKAGIDSRRGPYVEGKVFVGPLERADAAAGRLFLPASALLGAATADLDLAVSGFKIADGGSIQKRVLDMPARRFPLMSWPLGGIFAEAGAQLDFVFAADPIMADLSGRAVGLDIRTMIPTGVNLRGQVNGGVTARMLGGPQLGIGAYLGAPGIVSLSGGLRLGIPSVLHGAGRGAFELQYIDGKLQPKADIDQRIYFGMAVTPTPYYDLSLLGGAIARTGTLAPLSTIQLFEEKQIARLPLSFGNIDKLPNATESFDFTLGEVDATVPAPPPEVKMVPPTKVEDQQDKPGGDKVDTFGEAAWDALDKSFGDAPWYQLAKQALDFLAWCAKSLAITEKELTEALAFIAQYIDLKKLNANFFSNFTRPDGKTSKLGLVEAIARVALGRGNGDMHKEQGLTDDSIEQDSQVEVIRQFKVGLATVRIKPAATPGHILVVHDPFVGSAMEIDQEKSRMDLDPKQKVVGGKLVAKVAMGAWGDLTDVALALSGESMTADTAFKDATFVAGEKLAEVGTTLPGAVGGRLKTDMNDVAKVDLEQAADVSLPQTIGDMKLESPGVKVGFAQKERGAWALTQANTARLPFTGGQFVAQLDHYEVGTDGVSAGGILFMELDGLGRAGGNITIANNTLEQADLAFESDVVNLPADNPILGGNLKGGVSIANGGLDKAEIGMNTHAFINDARQPLGDLKFILEKGPTGAWVASFKSTIDPSLLAGLKLGDVAQIKALEVERDKDGKFGMNGRFDLNLPGLGEVKDAELGYSPGDGLSAKVEVPVSTSIMQGKVTATYTKKRMSVLGSGTVTAPGFEPVTGELEMASDVVRIKVDGNKDVLSLTFGEHKIAGGIDELAYHPKVGSWSGKMHLSGALPLIGEVVGEGALGDAADANAPFVKELGVRFVQNELVIPGGAGKVLARGALAGGLKYTQAGFEGAIAAPDMTLALPGLGKGQKLAFDGKYEAGKPSGKVSLVTTEPAPGAYFHLRSLEAKLGESGKVTGAGQVGVSLGGKRADLAASLREDGFSIAGTNIAFGTENVDKVWAKDVAVGYDSALGMFFQGKAHARMGGLDGALTLAYGAMKDGDNPKLSAMIEVEKTLMQGGAPKKVDLAALGPYSFFIAPIIPVLFNLFGEIGIKAALEYQFDALKLKGKALMTGLDLSAGTFDQVAFAPTLTGGATVSLLGGPSLGLIAALASPWAAYVKGVVDFKVGGRARMVPKLQGLVRYVGGELEGGASLSLPLYLSAIAQPTLSAEIGILNGMFSKRADKDLGQYMLFEPRKIFEVNLGMGALADPEAGEKTLASLVPDNPLAGAKAAGGAPPSQETDTTPAKVDNTYGEVERTVTGSPGDNDLGAKAGAFSFADVRGMVSDRFDEIRSEARRKYEAVEAIGNKIVALGQGIISSAQVTIEATSSWIASCFAKSPELALQRVLSAQQLEDIEAIDQYAGLKAKIAKIRLHQESQKEQNEQDVIDSDPLKRTLDSMSGMSSQIHSGSELVGAIGATILSYGINTVIHGKDHKKALDRVHALRSSSSLQQALDVDTELAREGDQREERLALVTMATVMMKWAVASVLDLLRPTENGKTVWDHVSSNKGSTIKAIRDQLFEEGMVRELWKAGEAKELQAVGEFFEVCGGYSMDDVHQLFEQITRTFTSGWVGGHGHKVRKNFESAGLL